MKNFLKYSCSFLTLAASCMLWAEDPAAIQELLKQGNQFLNAGDVKQAAAIAEQIGKQENGKIEAAFFKLQIANKMQDADGVKKQIGNILQFDIPVNRKIDALTTYARLCRSLKKMDECRQAYQDSLNLKPDDINHVYAVKMNIADTYWNADKKQHEKLLLELYHLDGITNDQKLRAMNELCSKLYSDMTRNDDLLKIVADAEKIPNLTYSSDIVIGISMFILQHIKIYACGISRFRDLIVKFNFSSQKLIAGGKYAGLRIILFKLIKKGFGFIQFQFTHQTAGPF